MKNFKRWFLIFLVCICFGCSEEEETFSGADGHTYKMCTSVSYSYPKKTTSGWYERIYTKEEIAKEAKEKEEQISRILSTPMSRTLNYFGGKKEAQITGYIAANTKEPGEFNLMVDGLVYSLTQTEVQIDGELVGVFPDQNKTIAINGVEYTEEEMVQCIDFIITEGLKNKHYLSGMGSNGRTISGAYEEAKGNGTSRWVEGTGFKIDK